MSRLFYHVMQDNLGNLLFDVSGTMRIAGAGTLATIYGDEALTAILPNPMTNHPSFGSFKCFLGAGDYDFYMAKGGYTFETLTGVQGHGTMAQQDANAVAITGGTATLTTLTLPPRPGTPQIGVRSQLAAGTDCWNLYAEGTAPNYMAGPLGVQALPTAGAVLQVQYAKATQNVLDILSTGLDTASGAAMLVRNSAGTPVGSITNNATATQYNTTSDARLKHDVAPLTGALDVVRRLRPVAFRWNADESPGHGFLAHELQQVIAEAVSGEPDQVNDDGSIRPQQVDHSRLVPWLTAALQETLAQVQALTARVATLEDGLGV